MAVGGRMTAKPGVVTTDQERALPESRTTATDAPEAAGLEVTTGSRIINPRLACACFIQSAGGNWESRTQSVDVWIY